MRWIPYIKSKVERCVLRRFGASPVDKVCKCQALLEYVHMRFEPYDVNRLCNYTQFDHKEESKTVRNRVSIELLEHVLKNIQ